MFIREPSFNKPADRHAAKQPQVPEEVSLVILLILVTSHGIMSNTSTEMTQPSPTAHQVREVRWKALLWFVQAVYVTVAFHQELVKVALTYAIRALCSQAVYSHTKACISQHNATFPQQITGCKPTTRTNKRYQPLPSAENMLVYFPAKTSDRCHSVNKQPIVCL